MLAMSQNGLDVGAVITHHFKVDGFEADFAAMKSGSSRKVVLDWT
jgi:threonine 3-dehydrogenase